MYQNKTTIKHPFLLIVQYFKDRSCFVLLLAPTGVSDPTGRYPNLFPYPAGHAIWGCGLFVLNKQNEGLRPFGKVMEQCSTCDKREIHPNFQ